MLRLAEITGVPVITTIMGKGAILSAHNLYVGNIGIHGSYAANTAISQCDVLFSIGTRFNDRITGKIEQFAQGATIIHVDIDSEIFRIAQVFHTGVIDYSRDSVLIESVQEESKNDDLITLLERYYPNRIKIVRGGGVAIETVSKKA